MTLKTLEQAEPKTRKKQGSRDSRGYLTKGHTANPNGRPKKGYSVTETMKEMFTANPEMKKKMIDSMYNKILEQQDVAAFKAIMGYLEGLPNQKKEESDQDQARQEHSTKLYDAIKQAL